MSCCGEGCSSFFACKKDRLLQRAASKHSQLLKCFQQLVATTDEEGGSFRLVGFKNYYWFNIVAVKGNIQIGNVDVGTVNSGQEFRPDNPEYRSSLRQ